MAKNDEFAIWGCFGILTLLAIIIGFGPLLSIWSLNTLFPVLAIPYTLSTWFAVLWLFGGIGSIINSMRRSK